MVEMSLNFDNFVDLHNFLDNSVYFDDFEDLPHDFYRSLKNSGHFDDFLNNSLDWNYFLDNIVNHFGNLDWNIHNSLYFPNLLYFHYLFDYLLDGHNLWHLHNSVYNSLDNFLNFHYFRDNSKDFEDIIYIYNTHNLLVDHSDYSLVEFRNISSFSF